MAYVSKEIKAKIVTEVKKVLPADWKATFAVRHHSTIVMTVRSAPFDLAAKFYQAKNHPDYCDVNHYHFAKSTPDQNLAATLEKIIDALNTDNYDNSDVMTDYFDVGHYVDLRFGEWGKPFINTLK